MHACPLCLPHPNEYYSLVRLPGGAALLLLLGHRCFAAPRLLRAAPEALLPDAHGEPDTAPAGALTPPKQPSPVAVRA